MRSIRAMYSFRVPSRLHVGSFVCALPFGPKAFTFALKSFLCAFLLKESLHLGYLCDPAILRETRDTQNLLSLVCTCVRTVKTVRSTSDPCVRLLSEVPGLWKQSEPPLVIEPPFPDTLECHPTLSKGSEHLLLSCGRISCTGLGGTPSGIPPSPCTWSRLQEVSYY